MAPKPINRRQFLAASGKTSASIAAGAAIFGAPRFAQAQSPGDRIILALIGAGGRAASHVSGMSRLPGVEFKKQLIFDGITERFTNNDEANALLKPAYRKHYRIPDQV